MKANPVSSAFVGSLIKRHFLYCLLLITLPFLPHPQASRRTHTHKFTFCLKWPLINFSSSFRVRLDDQETGTIETKTRNVGLRRFPLWSPSSQFKGCFPFVCKLIHFIVIWNSFHVFSLHFVSLSHSFACNLEKCFVFPPISGCIPSNPVFFLLVKSPVVVVVVVVAAAVLVITWNRWSEEKLTKIQSATLTYWERRQAAREKGEKKRESELIPGAEFNYKFFANRSTQAAVFSFVSFVHWSSDQNTGVWFLFYCPQFLSVPNFSSLPLSFFFHLPSSPNQDQLQTIAAHCPAFNPNRFPLPCATSGVVTSTLFVVVVVDGVDSRRDTNWLKKSSFSFSLCRIRQSDFCFLMLIAKRWLQSASESVVYRVCVCLFAPIRNWFPFITLIESDCKLLFDHFMTIFRFEWFQTLVAFCWPENKTW